MASKEKFVFGKNNVILILAGIATTLLGFALMIGGSSDDPNKFNYDEIFSPVRITLSPLLVIGGYCIVIFGIMKKPKTQA